MSICWYYIDLAEDLYPEFKASSKTSLGKYIYGKLKEFRSHWAASQHWRKIKTGNPEDP
jgi:hypothetical protein